MANWSKTFTNIDNVNSGQEFTNFDYPTPQGFNVPINNTQYLYNLLNNGFVNNVSVSSKKIVVSTKNASGTTTSSDITIGDIDGYTKGEIDNSLQAINDRLNELGFKTGSFTFDTSASITALINQIKKQGKYAISNLALTVTTTVQNTSLTIRVPNDFKPNQNTAVTLFEHNQLLNANIVISGIVIDTNGEIVLNIANTGTFTFGIQNSGWQLA